MSGPLNHSPADIVAQALIDLSIGTDPEDDGSWPIYVANQPDSPDNVISIFDTQGRQEGKTHPDSEVQEHEGISVVVRSQTHAGGFAKAHAAAIALDQVSNRTVSIESDTYVLHAVSRVGGVLPIGDEPGSNRKVFTVNAVVALTKTT